MTESVSTINQTACQILEIDYDLPSAPCGRCQRRWPSWATTGRTAVDLDLDHPVLLHVTVSLHYCADCEHYYRAQPPFLRRNATYACRVVEKAVQAVYDDGLAMRRVPERMGRDFWVRPSESIVRWWCQDYRAGFDFAGDYQPWVVQSFSGVLCIDEAYQDCLALLLAVDPAAPDGDRLVGYQLIHGAVTAQDVEQFLRRLQAAGIDPVEVITDGSSLYPTMLRQVWPQAAHQLCLFHETRRLTKGVLKMIHALRRQLPAPPPAGEPRIGRLGAQPPSTNLADPATQRWYWYKVQHRERLRQVQELAQQGQSQRAIARQTGHHRETVKRWLQQPLPELPAGLPAELTATAALPEAEQRRLKKQQQWDRIHELRKAGLSCAAIAREVGLHRVTVAKRLQQERPAEQPVAHDASLSAAEALPPPAPWSTWEQVRQIREDLREHRFLFLRRPEKLTAEEQQQLDALLASPIGSQLTTVRTFLVDWYRLWHTPEGQRRTLEEARTRYQAWRNNADYQAVPTLRRLQEQVTVERFDHLSQFLRRPEWEATNNGAERAGRAFRHQQAPHFNLRSSEAIAGALVVAACKRKEAATRTVAREVLRCSRGRKLQTPVKQAA